MLPDATASNLPLERLTRLYDGLEQLEDMWDEELSESGDSYGSQDEPEQVWALNERGEWEVDAEDGDDWSTDEGEAMEVDGEAWLSTDPTAMQLTEDVPVTEIQVTPEAATPEPPPSAARPVPNYVPETIIPAEDGDKPAVSASDEDKEKYWKRFDILASVPIDHAFYTSPPAQPSRHFLARLSKEYRVLSSSLPGTPLLQHLHTPLTVAFVDSVLVRTYEDRNDLLRCLIIGPENTPYEDAPFVIDWMLDSNFPQTPPIAHFHSWTNGNGRGMSAVDLARFE